MLQPQGAATSPTPISPLLATRTNDVPISPRQDLMFHLAGTVRLPSPPPSTGCVWIVAPRDPSNYDPRTLVFRVVHRISSRLYVERLVHRSDIRAINAPWEVIGKDGKPIIGKDGKPTTEHCYKTPEQFWDILGAFLKTLQPFNTDALWLINAVVYVPELAPVVLVAEAALTAAESAEYYPPLVGDGNMGGHSLGTVLTKLYKQAAECDSVRDEFS
jgi:hypothetical protein